MLHSSLLRESSLVSPFQNSSISKVGRPSLNPIHWGYSLYRLVVAIILVFISFHSFGQNYWDYNGNHFDASNKLGTTVDSPVNLFTNDIQRAIIISNPGPEPIIGFGTLQPQSNLHIYSAQTPPTVYDPNLEGREGDPVNPTAWIDIIRQGNSNNTHVEFRVSNREAEESRMPGMLFGITGYNGYIASAGKHDIHLLHERSSLSLSGDNMRFFDPFRNFTQAYASKISMYLKSYPGCHGLVIQGDQSQMANTVTVVSTAEYGNAFAVHQQLNNSSQVGNTTFQVQANGRTAIGMSAAEMDGNYMLEVAGKAKVCELKVSLSSWCDYVFDDTYQLPPLSDVEKYIQTYHHLPEIPTTAEVMDNGVEIGNMTALLLKKTEELTLYAIEMEKKLKTAEAELERLKELEERLKAIEEKLGSNQQKD